MGRLTSENRPQRGQFLPDLQAHSPAMGQKDGEKWTAAVDLQPTIPKSDGLLELHCADSQVEELVKIIAASARTGQANSGWVYIVDIVSAMPIS